MVSSARNINWRQGDIVSTSDLRRLVPQADLGDTAVGVVVSHDCDLAASLDKEPYAEIIPARPIERLGQDSHAKTARRLHLQYETQAAPTYYELLAIEKLTVPKAELLALDAKMDSELPRTGRRILQRWLALRYDRDAFPENFEKRLRQTSKAGKKSLVDLIAKALDSVGEHVRAVYFDLDGGEDHERVDVSDLYHLGVVVLYVANLEDDTAYDEATEAASRIEEILGDAEGIALTYCNAVSDSAMSLQEAIRLKEWRLEYLSYRTEPLGATLSD